MKLSRPFRAILCAVAALLLVEPRSAAADIACQDYGQDELTRNAIAVYRDFEDIATDPPREMRELNYADPYAMQPHIRGRPGYPYETSISFQMDMISGQPIPQVGAGRRLGPTDLTISLSSTWLPNSRNLPAHAGLPIGGSVGVFDYDVLGIQHGMTRVSYARALEERKAGRYSTKRNAQTEIFIGANEDIEVFMICSGEGVTPIPHCNFFQKIDDFSVKSRFRRTQLADLPLIKRRSAEFIQCMLRR